jgi:hypothetical protein
LNFIDGGACIGPSGLDDRKSPGIAQRFDRIGGRILGNDDDWTQHCHGDTQVTTENVTILRIRC